MSDSARTLGRARTLLLRGILLVLPLMGLVATEGTARAVFYLRYGVPGHSYGTSKYDPILGAVPREYSYNSNSSLNNFGFRNSEDVPVSKPGGSLRVITYGGSTTYCHHLSNDEAWPHQLQEALRRQRPGGASDQVLNGGVIMWSLGHSVEEARRDVPLLHPDAIVIYSGVNEVANAGFLAAEGLPMRELVARGEYGRFTTRLSFTTPFRNVITYKFLRGQVDQLRMAISGPSPNAPGADYVDPDVMTNYLETLRRFVTSLREQGVTPIFVKEVFDPSHVDATKARAFTAYSAQAATVAGQWGAIVVDPTAAFADAANVSKGLFQSTGIHMSVAGATLMATTIFDGAFRSQ